MSLTLITAMTSLRVLVGVAGVGYSIFANRDAAGNFAAGEIPKAIFGQAVGGVFYDWLKTGATAGYDNFLQRLESLDADALNHDLQRAARKATLLATFFACQGCLADIKSERQSIWKRFKNIAWKDEDINWLVAVSKSLKDEIRNIETATFDDRIDYRELFSIFDKDNIANTEQAQNEFAGKLKEETLKDVKNAYYAKLGGAITVPFSQNAFDLLSDAVRNGWEQYAEDRDFTIQLKLTAAGDRVKKYDWFKLLCVIFNEEYKVNEKIEAAMQKQTALEQTALLKQIRENLQSFGRIENFNDLERQISDFREENFWFHQLTHEKLNEILNLLRGQMRIFTQPLPVHNLPDLSEKVYGRETEKIQVLQALEANKFSLIVAPSGFGKTRLLAKALQDVSDGRNIKPEYNDKAARLMLIDCRLTGNLTDITREFNTVLGTQIVFENKLRNYNEAWCKTLFELIDGTTWLFLDNFEAWLDSSENRYRLLNAEIRAFLNALLDGNHGLRGIVLSQSEPEIGILEKLDTLEYVGEKLFEGLDEASAIEFLRANATRDNGLGTASESDLIEFLKSVSYIPQALNSLVGYLKSKRAYSFADFMRDEALQTGFDETEKDLTALERGERRTKALIQKQIQAQSEEVQTLLAALAFFVRPVPLQGLELLVSDKGQAGDSISRLTSHNLITRTTGLRGTRYYELHTYFREQSRIVLPKFEDSSESVLQNYSDYLLIEGNESYIKNYFNRARSLYESAESIESILVFKRGNINRRNALAKNYVNKGVAIQKQGKLTEAIIEYDRAIAIQERLVQEKQQHIEACSDLAMTYNNKGLALWHQDKLTESISEYDKAIKIFKQLVRKKQGEESAHGLAMAYMNKGLSFKTQGKFTEAITEYNKSIKISERLVNEEKREELANSLATAYVNKGISLRNQGKLAEAVIEYNKAIGIRERLVNKEKREELADDLAKTYWGKGNVLADLGKLGEALDKYSAALKLWERCLQRNELHILPNLFKVLYLRVNTLFEQENWNLAAQDIRRALKLHREIYEYLDFSEHFKMQISESCNNIIQLIRDLPAKKRKEIYKYAGEYGKEIKQLIEDSGKN